MEPDANEVQMCCQRIRNEVENTKCRVSVFIMWSYIDKRRSV